MYVDLSQVPSPDTIQLDESPCFIIHEVTLTEADGTKPARVFLKALKETLNTSTQAKGLLGHCYDAQGINVIMSRLQNAIIKRGYVTTRIVAGPKS